MSISNEAIVTGITVEDAPTNVARRLAEIHGPVVLRKEASGLHAYMACPDCLVQHGRRELRSRHLALNIDKYLGIGDFAMQFRPDKAKPNASKGYCQCMKTGLKFTFQDLMCYPKLSDRGMGLMEPAIVIRDGGSRYLIPDEHGILVPDHPGKTVKLSDLDYKHPAHQYLHSRNFDPIQVERQFGARWCVEEAPEGEEYNRWYRKHPDGWKSTPQGRIIFYSRILGSEHCWQGRYLEMMGPNGRPVVWHPYRARWEPKPEWPKGQEPIKYVTATGAYRNSQVCGWDAVVASQAVRGGPMCCVLTEGPLDAARFPNHGIAILGKSMSPSQALLIASRFRHAVLAFDADEYGFKTCDQVAALLGAELVKTTRFFEPGCNVDPATGAEVKMDPGMMEPEEAADRLRVCLGRLFG